MLLGGDPCEEHSLSNFYCLGGASAEKQAASQQKNNDYTNRGGQGENGQPLQTTPQEQQQQQQQQESVRAAAAAAAVMAGKDSPPTSLVVGQREKRFPAVGTNRYMAPEVEFDSRFGVQVRTHARTHAPVSSFSCVPRQSIDQKGPLCRSIHRGPTNERTNERTNFPPTHVLPSFHPRPQADIFSLGVVLHVLLTGAYPKTGLNEPARIDAGIPDVNGLRALLEGMLHGDPYQRPHSFEVLDLSLIHI